MLLTSPLAVVGYAEPWYVQIIKSLVIFAVALVVRIALLVSPMMPHLAEECWAVLGHGSPVSGQAWPQVEPLPPPWKWRASRSPRLPVAKAWTSSTITRWSEANIVAASG